MPISENEKIIKKAEKLKEEIEEIASVEIDKSEKTFGEKLNYWEMKGVPIRIEIGPKEIEKNNLTIFRRDLDKKEVISEKDLIKYIERVSEESDENLTKKADKLFENRIKEVKKEVDLKKVIESGFIGRANFCSVEIEGEKCAERIEKEIGATIRGTLLEKEKASGKCIICGKKANEVVYIARQY